jgi:hypothetical protein
MSTTQNNQEDAHIVLQFPGQEFKSAAPRHIAWAEPKPLPNGLSPVAEFDYAFLPSSISPWVEDIAERMQCPPDFVGVSAVTALGSVLGRKVAIRPKRYDDWMEVANFWSAIIGRPGVMKSPAMKEALKPLTRLEMEAEQEFAEESKKSRREAEMHKLQKEARLSNLKGTSKN